MKKFIMSLAIMLASLSATAMESVTSARRLVEVVTQEKRLVAVVYTMQGHEKTKIYKSLVSQFEKTNNKDVVFVLAPLENQDITALALNLGVSSFPTTVFSRSGKVVAATTGTPRTADDIKVVVQKVLEMEKTEESKPAAPQKNENDEEESMKVYRKQRPSYVSL